MANFIEDASQTVFADTASESGALAEAERVVAQILGQQPDFPVGVAKDAESEEIVDPPVNDEKDA